MREFKTATNASNPHVRKLRPRLMVALALCLGACMTVQSGWAQSFVLEIEIDPGQAGAMPVYEVDLGGDVDSLELYRFAENCHRRASVSTGTDWSLEYWSPDDQLVCRFRDATRILEMELETTTSPVALRKSQTRRPSEPFLLARVAPEAGYEQRVRFDFQGDSWSPWTTGAVLKGLPVPEAGQERTFHFEVERRGGGSSATISETGYLKIKKISS